MLYYILPKRNIIFPETALSALLQYLWATVLGILRAEGIGRPQGYGITFRQVMRG